MPTLSELIEQRVRVSEQARAAAMRAVRSQQQEAYTTLIEWALKSLAVADGGRIKYTVGNVGKVAALYTLMDRVKRKFRAAMLDTVLSWSDEIARANEAYFLEFSDKKMKRQAIDKALLRWGYDAAKKEVLVGSYFDGVFRLDGVSNRVAALVNRAIIGGMPLSDFQRTFRAVFVGSKPGEGVLERHWRTASFDLFQRIDRGVNLEYAEGLGLSWAVYSGTLEEDSRPFCIARVNKVYTREEIEDWARLSFKGKPKIYDPKTDCGGYNCRHHLSWVSDGVGQALRAKQNKN